MDSTCNFESEIDWSIEFVGQRLCDKDIPITIVSFIAILQK